MNMSKEKEMTFKTTRREATEEIKNMRIEDIHGLHFHIDILQKLGIHTIGELLSIDTEKLIKIYQDRGIIGATDMIFREISDMGLIFDDHKKIYKKLNISEEIALIPMKEINLQPRIKKILQDRRNIYYLGDLLRLHYIKLVNTRGLNDEDIIEIKKYVHSIGFSLEGEEETLTEIKRSKGDDLIEISLGLSNKTANILYRNNIFTIHDLLNYGPGIFRVFGMGEVKINEIKLAMKSKGIYFTTPSEITIVAKVDDVPILPSKVEIEKLKRENKIIQARIDKKKSLLDEYNLLLKEQESLKLIEKELDELIAESIPSLNKEGDTIVRR